MRVFFWNTCKKNIVSHIEAVGHALTPDFILLAECDKNLISILTTRLCSYGYSHLLTPGCDKIDAFTKYDLNDIKLLSQTNDFSAMRIKDLILVVTHQPSQYSHSDDELRRAGEKMVLRVAELESAEKLSTSVIVGDFNANPFEMSMISFTGICSTNHRDILNPAITRSKETRKLFYNPMWTLYGKEIDHPGTFHYSRSGTDLIKWHMLDQVIIRPSLINRFQFDKLEILSHINGVSLKKGRKITLSDHLPLIFSIK